MKKPLVALAATVALLAVPAAANAASWTVYAGSPPSFKPPAGTPKSASPDEFYPAKISVRAGDSVKFLSDGFHTVAVPGGTPAGLLALAAPDPAGGTYAATNDAAGTPFAFSGLPKVTYNPRVFGPSGGTKVASDKSFVNSGVLTPEQNKKPFKLTFAKAGTYHLACLVHKGMKLTVTVKGKKAHVQSASQVKSTVAKQLATTVAQAKKLAATKVPANTVYEGLGSSPTLIAFTPDNLTVQVGQPVTFINKSPTEPHSAVFGGDKAYWDAFFKATDLLPFGPGAPNQITPIDIYGTDPGPPGAPYTYAGATQHGNGAFATPLTDDLPGDPPTGLAGQHVITFTTPGTYHYFCAIHGPDMSGTVTVTQ